MATVLVTGTFDGLHPGHEDLFRQAKSFGDRVVAVIARDRTVLDVKGQLPRISEEDRRAAVESHPFIDKAVLGKLGDKLAIIVELKPDVIVLGYDQKAFTNDLETHMKYRNVVCKIVRAKPFHPDKFKSSILYGRSGDPEDVEEGIEKERFRDWLPF
jgi:FAD synthetase